MDFGKVHSLDGLDLSLPDDPISNAKLLASLVKPKRPPTLRVGSPRWADPGYVGRLYPPGTRSTGYLRAYAEQLPTIELNATWYRCEFTQNEKWADQVPPSFRFCPKLPQAITFDRRLRESGELVREFVASIRAFGEKCGPAWALLPSDFGPREFDALGQFVRDWPREVPLAIEFRHPGWFEDSPVREDAFSLLEQAGMGTVITDVAGRRDVLHMRLTAAFVLVRLVGNDLHPTDFARAEDWARRLNQWLGAGLHEAYLFLHQPEEYRNLPMVVHTLEAFNAVSGSKLPLPRLYDEPAQGSLF